MALRKRHEDVKDVVGLLKDHLPAMGEVLEHTRPNRTGAPSMLRDGRKVKECVAVMLVEEADGSETVMILGDADAERLELKGVLHDGIYAFWHMGDPDYRTF